MAIPTTFYNLLKALVGEAYDVTLTNGNLDKIDTALGGHDKYAKGLVYELVVTGNTGAVTNSVIDNIASFTFKANRRYKIVWDFSYLQNGTGDLFFYQICSCAVADAPSILTGLTILRGRTKGINSSTPGSTFHTGAVVSNVKYSVDTTVQLKFVATRVNGNNTTVVTGNNGEERVYQIFDDGAQI